MQESEDEHGVAQPSMEDVELLVGHACHGGHEVGLGRQDTRRRVHQVSFVGPEDEVAV